MAELGRWLCKSNREHSDLHTRTQGHAHIHLHNLEKILLKKLIAQVG